MYQCCINPLPCCVLVSNSFQSRVKDGDAPKRLFVTGASGCIGHYVTEALIRETGHELYLLVRDPQKLKLDTSLRPGIKIIQGDLRQVDQFSDLLATMDGAVLLATCWGGPKEIGVVNVDTTLALLNRLNPQRCQQVIYFSTASILDRNNQLLHQAGAIGTDYIRTKYECYLRLKELAIASQITTIFPTLVFGGDDVKPKSHLSAGLEQVTNWIGGIRFLRPDGSFHFMHARDIAQVVRHLVDHPPENREIILGNPAITANQAIEQVAAYMGYRVSVGVPLSIRLANLLIALFRVQMADWDWFCLQYRHFVYQNPVGPATYGLQPYCATIADVMRLSGIQPRHRRADVNLHIPSQPSTFEPK